MLNYSILILELGMRMSLKIFKSCYKIVFIDHPLTHGKHESKLKVL